jgi:hypothetical protein
MATPLSDLQDRLDRLRKARASGVSSSTHGDTTTAFKSDIELAAAIADLERQIAGLAGKPVRTVYFSTSKGI